jgi:HEAT repeat protein
MKLWPFGKNSKEPSLLINELQNPDVKIREEAFNSLITNELPKTDNIILGALESFDELPDSILVPLIEVAVKRKILECLPIFKACLSNPSIDVRHTAFTALTSIQTQESLDAIISALGGNDIMLKQKIRTEIIEHFGREALGALIRGVPKDKTLPIYFEIVSIMEDLDLFSLIKSNFRKPDEKVKEFYFETLTKFNRPEFLPLYLEYYPNATHQRKTKIEEILLEYSVKEVLEAFREVAPKSLENYHNLFDITVIERFSTDKGEVFAYLSSLPETLYRRKMLLRLLENIDIFCYSYVFDLLKDSSSEIRSASLKILSSLISETWERISDTDESNKPMLIETYNLWEKQTISLMREPLKMLDEQRKCVKKLFFIFVKHKHSIVNNFIKDLFQNSFGETYNAIREWKFDEQIELYDWVIKSDPSFGALILSGLNLSSEDNMWRLVLKLSNRFSDKEDSDIFIKNLVARYRNITIDKYAQDTDPEIRKAALSFVSFQGPANLIDIAKSSLKDFVPSVRLMALKILESHRYTEFDNALKDAMGDPDNDVCMYAIETLKQRLEPEAFVPLVAKFLNSTNENVRNFAVKEVAQLTKLKYKENFNKMPVEIRKLAGKVIQKIDNGFGDQIIEDLSSFDPQTRLQAVLLLENIEVGEKAKNALISAMKDPSKQVRAAVVKTLGLLGDPELIKHLISFFNDPDTRVRANTVEAVASMGDRQVIKFLLPFIEDENNRIRGNAVLGIKKLGNYNVTPVLQKMLSHQDSNMRATGIWVMGEIKDSNYLPFLYPFVNDSDETIRYNAVKSISKINPQILAKYYFNALRKDSSEKIRKLVEELSYRII